ncbi:MAG TPA: ABC transporter ATP-binding protein [Nitrospirota bacterium]
MLEIEGLAVSINGKRILQDVSLSIGEGQIMALFGPNGSGKTTLQKTIMGFPAYRVDSGRILYKGEDITSLGMDERSRRGIGLAFQTPPVVRGVKLRDILKSAMGKRDLVMEDKILEYAQKLKLSEFLSRDINLGFSGGEIKRSELLQLLAQDPDLILFDEPDSGVDLENIKLVGDVMDDLLGKSRVREKRLKSGLIITHQGYILDYVNPDKACIMIEGSIRCVGNPRDILREIRKSGYEECVRCLSLR